LDFRLCAIIIQFETAKVRQRLFDFAQIQIRAHQQSRSALIAVLTTVPTRSLASERAEKKQDTLY